MCILLLLVVSYLTIYIEGTHSGYHVEVPAVSSGTDWFLSKQLGRKGPALGGNGSYRH